MKNWCSGKIPGCFKTLENFFNEISLWIIHKTFFSWNHDKKVKMLFFEGFFWVFFILKTGKVKSAKWTFFTQPASQPDIVFSVASLRFYPSESYLGTPEKKLLFSKIFECIQTTFNANPTIIKKIVEKNLFSQKMFVTADFYGAHVLMRHSRNKRR